MADGSSGPSYGDLSSLRSELMREINDVRSDVRSLQSWAEREIDRLEREMREVGAMIVDAIERQTVAVVGGVAATTVMLERTKRQIEDDFAETRNKLQMQLESTLQIEIGKKVADVSASRNKLLAFTADIKNRFDNSLQSVSLNRELYNLNFRKISEEYDNKIRTIGAHIFQVRSEDIAPAVKAAQVTYESAHSLPIEMDLKRLAVRSENLEETLNVLKSSRLDEVVASLDTLGESLGRVSITGALPAEGTPLCVEGIATSSRLSTRLVMGCVAEEVKGQPVALSLADPEFSMFEASNVAESVSASMGARSFRNATGIEIVALVKAATELKGRNLISEDAHALLGDFLGSGNLQFLEA